MNCAASIHFQFLHVYLSQFLSSYFFSLPVLSHFLELLPCNPLYSSLCHLGMHPWTNPAWLGLAALPESPYSLKKVLVLARNTVVFA